MTTPPRECPINEIRLGITSFHHSLMKLFISSANSSPYFHISISVLSSFIIDERNIVCGKLAARLDLITLISFEVP